MQAFLGIRIGRFDLDGLLTAAMRAVETRDELSNAPFTFACANPHSLVCARSDAEFRAALQDCSAVVADGIGVKFAARLINADVGPRITGTDFFLGMMSRLNNKGGRALFFGSTDAVLTRIVARARLEFPNVLVDVISPPFGAWDAAVNQQLIERIAQSRPDVLWVGMTAPKQEKWVHAQRGLLHVPVIGSIGAVFDFYAGSVARAPEWMCRLGLEWLYRLWREPRRLWRRTVVSGPAFIWMVLQARRNAPTRA